MSKRWVVYWVKSGACRDPARHGYVGATGRLWQRVERHRTGRLAERFASGCKVEILFRGSREECLALERKLRPHPDIGWNIGRGGFCTGAGMRGIPKSAAHCEKIRQAALRRYADPKERLRTQLAVAEALKRIDRTGKHNGMFGKHHSEATKQVLREKVAARDMTGPRNPNYRHGGYIR